MKKNKLFTCLFFVFLGALPLKLSSQNQPAGYNIVWSDEFNEARLSDGSTAFPSVTNWSYESGGNGWGNQELQYYVKYSGIARGDTVATIYNGSLKIKALNVTDNPYYGMNYTSARINTPQSWTYGYFEARIKQAGGKGTWPAFWMLPKNGTVWPLDGEIDIVEYVGVRPNIVTSSIHCQAYNGINGLMKTSNKTISNAETEYHVYAIEWTESKITGYVDNIAYFNYYNDNRQDINTWPFNKAFYLKINLAIGGTFGGTVIDPTIFPAKLDIDYVRVYQKSTAVNTIVDTQLQVFPTVFSGEINICTIAPTAIRIYDSLGRIVFNKMVTGKELVETNNLKSGIYLLKHNEKTIKLIKL